MKTAGSIRLGSKRAGVPSKPGPGEIAVDVDRKNRIPAKSHASARRDRRRPFGRLAHHALRA